MSGVGGSIESLSIAGRLFAVAADAESQRKLGGFENEVMANGDGTARIVKTRVPLRLDGLSLMCDDDNGDQEFLQDVSNATDFVPIVITYASGISYQGSAMVTGDFQTSSQNATTAVTLDGPGILTRQ